MKHKLFELLALQGVRCRGVVQVEASSGQEVDAFRHYGLERAILIEPLEEPFRELSQAVQDIEGFVPVQALCSSRVGQELVFHLASNGGQSSSFMEPRQILVDYPKVKFQGDVRLVSTTVDAVVAGVARGRADLAGGLDLLFLDVQGAELPVLMGAVALLQDVRAVWTEVSYDQYADGASLEDVQAFLRPFALRLYDVRLGPQGWGNALFLKRR